MALNARAHRTVDSLIRISAALTLAQRSELKRLEAGHHR